MTALVILFPAAFVNITELLVSKLSAKVGIHRYNTANRGAQTLSHLQSTSRLQTTVIPVTRGFLNSVAYCVSTSADSRPQNHPNSALCTKNIC